MAEIECPFSNEVEFKKWLKDAARSKAVGPPADFAEPNDEERDVIHKLRPLINPEHAGRATDFVLSRLVRAWYFTEFTAGAEQERLERTAVMGNLTLAWWAEIDIDALPDKVYPRQAEWDTAWPSTMGGVDVQGRVVWYMKFPADFSKSFSPDETRQFHVRDLAAVRRKRQQSMEAHGRKFVGGRYQVIIDMKGDRSAASIAFIKFFSEAIAHPRGPSLDEYFFPDVLAKAWVVNCPAVYRALWSVAKKLMDTAAREKYSIMGADDLVEKLAAGGIPATSLPLCMGGNAPNPRGTRHKIDSVAKAETAVLELIPAKDTSPVGLGWWFMSKRAFRYKISCKSGSEIAQLEDGAFEGAATPVSGVTALAGKVYDSIVIELENAAGKSTSVTYGLDLDYEERSPER